MQAINTFVVLRVEKKAQKTTKAGIIVPMTGETVTTNSGDKVGTTSSFIVESIGKDVKADIKKGDVVIVNPWATQLFEDAEDNTFAVVPENEIKVVL